jgi:predicted dinucleotide-binding enzyme
MRRKIGIIGSGAVGISLANGFNRHGYDVMLGTNNPDKHQEIKTKTNFAAAIGTFSETAKFADLLVLAVKGSGAEAAIDKTGIENLSGKTVLDATNPIADAPPVNGVLSFFTSLSESLMERLQRRAPGAHFVKCFSIVGNTLMIDPDFNGTRPTMFICGNDENAKQRTQQMLDEIGWEAADMGSVEAARAIEPLCILWCIPGFLEGKWQHAFKLLRKN